MRVADDAVSWMHRPQDGPVAWGIAILIAPAVPLLSILVVVALVVVLPGDDNALPVALSPTPWLVVGLLVARPSSGRIPRGVGVGLVAGSVASLVLAVVAGYGGWQ